MTDTPNPTASRTGQLRHCGDAREMRHWKDGDPDYVQKYGLCPDDAAALIDLLPEWLDDGDWPDDPNDMTAWAPVHAWRALGQLRATAAVAPILNMMEVMDARDDDWYLEEFPDVFAMMGPPAFDAVADYLSDRTHAVYPRICAADALKTIAREHPSLREPAVMRLVRELSDYETHPVSLNTFLVLYLVNLRATEAAELIERVFAAGCVDEFAAGDWDEVRARLGVEGMGLVPPRRGPRRTAPGLPTIEIVPSGPKARGFKSRKTEQRKKKRAARRRRR